MDKITVDDAKQILLEVLTFIHQYCEAKHLRYALCGGALIGAIRHGGFIPWDDDIDIIMPRGDYERMLKDFNESNNRYKLHCLDNDIDYNLPFAKIEDTRTIIVEKSSSGKEIGISVDVFPADLMGRDMNSSIQIVRKLKFLKKIYKGKLVVPNKRNSFMKKIGIYIVKILASPYSLRELAKKINSRSLNSGENNAGFMGCLCWGYEEREIMPRELFDDYIEIKFEGKSFMTFKNFDLYLKTIYGNYMQLPPIEKRYSPHEITDIFMK